MNLLFSNPNTINKIIAHKKICHILEDEKGEWLENLPLCFWKKDYELTIQFGSATVRKAVPVRLEYYELYPYILIYTNDNKTALSMVEVMKLAENSGNDLHTMYKKYVGPNWGTYEGKIIYWENCKFK